MDDKLTHDIPKWGLTGRKVLAGIWAWRLLRAVTSPLSGARPVQWQA
jgi:hypothetical protein